MERNVIAGGVEPELVVAGPVPQAPNESADSTIMIFRRIAE
jgi:hypothetical protein